MVYSVFDWDQNNYEYFQSDHGPRPGERPTPRKKFFEDGDGVRPEDVLPVLPEDAIRIGAGTDARGRVAIRAESVSGFGAAPEVSPFFQEHPYLTVALVVGGSYLAWKALIVGARRIK